MSAQASGGHVLVLTREARESIMIGDEIEVSVVAIGKDAVRIGIRAPRSIPVSRIEIYHDIQRDSGEGDDPGQ